MRTSEVLTRLAAGAGERLSVGMILDGLGDRSFALLIVILGLPNCIPMPPPIPLVCSLLLVVVGFQMTIGMKTPWMPAYMLRSSVARVDYERAYARALPYLLRLERFSQPRFTWLGRNTAEFALGVLLIALAIGLLTAAPFIGQIPWGIAVCLLGLGIVERDGLLVLGAIFVGIIGAFLSAGFIYAIFIGIKSSLF